MCNTYCIKAVYYKMWVLHNKVIIIIFIFIFSHFSHFILHILQQDSQGSLTYCHVHLTYNQNTDQHGQKIILCWQNLTCCILQSAPLTCVDAGSELQPLVGHVRDGDLSDGCHQVQCHLSDLISMSVTISLRQTAHHHVRIPNCFHLGFIVWKHLEKFKTITKCKSRWIMSEDIQWINQGMTLMMASGKKRDKQIKVGVFTAALMFFQSEIWW